MLFIFQKSAEDFLEHVFPDISTTDGQIPYNLDGEFGTKVVRIILTASMDQESHDAFLAQLHSIRYCNISYDLVDKLGSNMERGIPPRPVVVQKSGNKQIEALALLQKCMLAADIGYRKGYVYKRPREAR